MASALLLTGCTGDAAPDAGMSDLDPKAQTALQIVEDRTRPVGSFEAPGPALGDLSSLAGETVFYIPATLEVPMFRTIGTSVTDALGRVGVDVQVCDGRANPSDIAGCLGQAIEVGAAAVISGSIPDELAPEAFQAIRDAGIPLLYSQLAPAGPGEPDRVAYLTPDTVEMQSWIANWVIADSDASADVLVVKVMDTPATIKWIDDGAIATYTEACPECTVTVVEAVTGMLDLLPAKVTAALDENPAIGYIHVAFDVAVGPTILGIEPTKRFDLKIVSHDGTLGVMQNLVAGKNVSAEVGFSQRALGWYAADQVLRMMSGADSVQGVEFPYRRMFTRESANLVEFTNEAEALGIWYGRMDYEEGFLKLWGVD